MGWGAKKRGRDGGRGKDGGMKGWTGRENRVEMDERREGVRREGRTERRGKGGGMDRERRREESALKGCLRPGCYFRM